MQFADYTVHQSHGWSKHKSGFGWTAHRLTATEGGRTVAAAQVLVRRFPLGTAVAWVPGGPVGQTDSWGQPLRSAIQRISGVRHLYCRINPTRLKVAADVERLAASGWRRAHAHMNSGISFAYALFDGESGSAHRASGNWPPRLRTQGPRTRAV